MTPFYIAQLHYFSYTFQTSVDGKWPVTVIDYLHNEIVNKHCTIQVLVSLNSLNDSLGLTPYSLKSKQQMSLVL